MSWRYRYCITGLLGMTGADSRLLKIDKVNQAFDRIFRLLLLCGLLSKLFAPLMIENGLN